jgi:hypothetical protein
MLSSINKKRILQLAAPSIALMLVFISSPAAGNATAPEKEASKEAAAPNPVAEKCGIEITSIRMTANNHMVDFRYRVLDAKKADALFTKETRPHLVHQKTGKVLAVPRTAKVGPLMSTYQHKNGRIYWMFFGNQTNLVHAGDEVSVVIGDVTVANLKVE